jgi:hypothetical protein
MFASTDQPPAFPPLLAESREYSAGVLFNRIYELEEDAPAASRRRALLQDGAGRAVRLLERRRIEARRIRYGVTPGGPFAVIEWVPTYDGRDAITGHAKHTVARFETFEDAERFIEGEYSWRDCAEYGLEIEGPYCVVRLPLYKLTDAGNELPF